MIFQNEIILLLSVVVLFGGLVATFRFFGKDGIYCWNVICTIAANIEVLILVDAFGMEMTLGNVIFASTFLATDICSELYGKKEASKCVKLGLLTNVVFILISQSWFLYVPSQNDTFAPAIKTIFSNTPRVMFASLLAYVVSQVYDVWSYHFLWNITEKKSNSKTRFLWIRNNVSTLVAQFINTVLFNVVAFYGVFPTKTLVSAIFGGYLIYVFTSILDTPFLYLARKFGKKTE